MSHDTKHRCWHGGSAGKQSHGKHLPISPNWIHQNHYLKFRRAGTCLKPVSTMLHFPLLVLKSEGPSVIAITVDSCEGYIFREGRLLTCFVKWETSNRSPVLDLDHCEPEQTTAEFRRTITFAELSCYTYHLSFSSQKHLLFTTTLEQIAMPLLPGKLSSLFSPLPVSPVCWCIRMYS